MERWFILQGSSGKFTTSKTRVSSIINVHQTEDLLSSILGELIVMIGAARLMNSALRRIGQPGVVGEIIAGLALGPSLLGHFLPHVAHVLFGRGASMPITIISQIGLVLLMFQIGMAFEFRHLQTWRNAHSALAVAIASVSVPFVLGLMIGHWSAPSLAPAINPSVYSLFVGVGLAITAVPILGRILRQYGLTRTRIGVIAITSAAVNDVVGWILLAGVTAIAAARFSMGQIAWQMAGLALLLGALWFLLRPFIDWLLRTFPLRDGTIPPNLMAVSVILCFSVGICTYKLGIFTIFGGFAAGLLFHRHEAFVNAWRHQAGQFVTVFFLPVFFTFTGLRTNVLGLTGADLAWLGVILIAAVLGKMLPVYWTGRVMGFSPAESWTLGALMNTRALMELIVLNVGFDLGFLPQRVFTMLVIMAVVTTVMTGPLLSMLLPRIDHSWPQDADA